MLSHAREILARLEPEMPRFFRRLPRAPVGVRPIAPDLEASTASNYTAGTPDGTRAAEAARRLAASATDLGSRGRDHIYGDGLVGELLRQQLIK